MILRRATLERIFYLGLRFREIGARSGHYRQKMRFFAVAMATDEPIWLKLERAQLELGINHPTKFRCDRFNRLRSGAVRYKHTDRRTDGNRDSKADLASRRSLRSLLAAGRSRNRREA